MTAPTTDLIEAVAADVHAAWMDAKRAQGITSRPAADGREQMVPYADLDDDLQELDRATVRAVLASPTLVAVLPKPGVPDRQMLLLLFADWLDEQHLMVPDDQDDEEADHRTSDDLAAEFLAMRKARGLES